MAAAVRAYPLEKGVDRPDKTGESRRVHIAGKPQRRCFAQALSADTHLAETADDLGDMFVLCLRQGAQFVLNYGEPVERLPIVPTKVVTDVTSP